MFLILLLLATAANADCSDSETLEAWTTRGEVIAARFDVDELQFPKECRKGAPFCQFDKRIVASLNEIKFLAGVENGEIAKEFNLVDKYQADDFENLSASQMNLDYAKISSALRDTLDFWSSFDIKIDVANVRAGYLWPNTQTVLTPIYFYDKRKRPLGLFSFAGDLYRTPVKEITRATGGGLRFTCRSSFSGDR